MKGLKPKKLLANAMKWGLIGVVAAFTALLSYGFWQWTFPPERWYFALLGFGLTGGGTVVYLAMLMWDENTSLRNTIALVMLVVSIVGEIVTAGYGIKIESWTRAGITPTQQDYDFMQVAVQGLLLFHFMAIIVYFAGDRIAELFRDEDGDGIPNYRDRDYKPNKSSNNHARVPQDAPRIHQDVRGGNFQSIPNPNGSKPSGGKNQQLNDYRQYDLGAFLAAVHMNKDSFSGWMAERDLVGETETREALLGAGLFPSDMSKNNFKKLFYQMFPQNERRANF